MRIGNRTRLPGRLLPASVFVLEFTALLAGCSGRDRARNAVFDGTTARRAGRGFGRECRGVPAPHPRALARMRRAPWPMRDRSRSRPPHPPANLTGTDVGATPLQRLARVQYANAVRDLLEVEIPLDQLPEDEKFGAFDGNIAVRGHGPAGRAVRERGRVRGAAGAARDRSARALRPRSAGRRRLRARSSSRRSAAARTGGRSESEELEQLRAAVRRVRGHGLPRRAARDRPDHAAVAELPVPRGAACRHGGRRRRVRAARRLRARLAAVVLPAQHHAGRRAARSGRERRRCTTSGELAEQADRLLADPRLSDTLASFHLQWLELDKLASLSKDETLFPAFTPELGAAMRDETLRFVDHVMREDDARLETLLTAPYSFPDGPAARDLRPAGGRRGRRRAGRARPRAARRPAHPAGVPGRARPLQPDLAGAARQGRDPQRALPGAARSAAERERRAARSVARRHHARAPARAPERPLVRQLPPADRRHRHGLRALRRDRRVPQHASRARRSTPRARSSAPAAPTASSTARSSSRSRLAESERGPALHDHAVAPLRARPARGAPRIAARSSAGAGVRRLRRRPARPVALDRDVRAFRSKLRPRGGAP